ncbi:MAG: sigma-54-dependent Fis family transcriptional regulator [Acidobacteria bacterium]|nr:sigma-54-dependent Fis family transcriptional regulator [Acidobacteriota bacterium]
MTMEKATARILVIDDEPSVCVSCKKILREDGHEVEYCLAGLEGVRRAIEGDCDLVLLDLKMPDLSGMEALERIRAGRPELPVVIITGYATIQTSIEAVRKGAFDYIPKPFTPEELSLAVHKALEDRRLRRENEFLRQELSVLHQGTPILGRSKAIEDILRQVLKVAPTDFTITLYGESGTGKELLAREIHRHSRRSERPLVAVDLSALSPTLLESELFGHVKGAFTGATQTRPGYFSIAHEGTLFLDEIANVSLELQGKLLRVLESRRLHAVGSEREQEVDVRVIAATNRDLYQLVEQGRFREDLYYRLNVIPIVVPPLRERTEDVPLLAHHFLEQARQSATTRVRGFTGEAMARLVAYLWPGNVRELRNIVERLVATVDDEAVRLEHLPPEIRGGQAAAASAETGPAPENAEQLKASKLRLKQEAYDRLEKGFVLRALERAGWNVTRAALQVGMARPNFHALMRRFGIRARDGEGPG